MSGNTRAEARPGEERRPVGAGDGAAGEERRGGGGGEGGVGI